MKRTILVLIVSGGLGAGAGAYIMGLPGSVIIGSVALSIACFFEVFRK